MFLHRGRGIDIGEIKGEMPSNVNIQNKNIPIPLNPQGM